MTCAGTAWASLAVGGVMGFLFTILAGAMVVVWTYGKAVRG